MVRADRSSGCRKRVVGDPRPGQPVPPELDRGRRCGRTPRRRRSGRPGLRPTTGRRRRGRPCDSTCRARAVPPSMPISMSVLSRNAGLPASAASAGDPRRRRGSRSPRPGRSRTPARRRSSTSTVPSRHSTVRTSRWRGVVVGGRPGVRGHGVRALPRPHHERVVHQEPAARGVPGGRQHVGAWHVGACGRHVDAVGAEPERPGSAVEDVAEDARRVERREAQPVDRAVGRHQGAGVAVGEEPVVGDRWEGRGAWLTSPSFAGGCGRRRAGASPYLHLRPVVAGTVASPHRDELARLSRAPSPGRRRRARPPPGAGCRWSRT